MARIVIAILFVFAFVAPSALIDANQDGIRLPPIVDLPSTLSEYADCDDAGHNFIIATIVPATPALERVLPLPFEQILNRTQQFDRDSVPRYDMHAAWRI